MDEFTLRFQRSFLDMSQTELWWAKFFLSHLYICRSDCLISTVTFDLTFETWEKDFVLTYILY